MARQHDVGRRRTFFLCLAVMLAAGSWVAYKLVVGDLEAADQFGGVGAFLLALLMAIPALRSWLWSSEANEADEQRMMNTAERGLRERVREVSQREKGKWSVDDPRPLAVRWHVVTDGVDHKTNIYGHTGETQQEDLAVHGTFSTVREFYESIPPQRMVIQGDPGAGKTVLAHHLIATLLHKPEDDQPVPVLFSLNTWNPYNAGLSEWLIEQLSRDYPHLNGEHPTGRTLATVLVRRDRILPILDGFDEIPEQFRIEAIEEISRFDGPLVVTTRRDEYLAATGKARAVGKADGITLKPPSLDDVQRYLHDSTGTTQAAAWTRVFDHLHTKPDEPACHDLATVLSVPLMVTLARTIYRTTDHGTPTDLLDISRSGGRNSLEEHLLDTYIDTVYDPRHPPTDDATKQPSWTPDQARRWLGYLADHLSQRNTHDLAWWQLGTTLSRQTRIITIMFVAGLMYGLVRWLLNQLLSESAPNPVDVSGIPHLAWLWLSQTIGLGLASGLVNELKFRGNRPGWQPERFRLTFRQETAARRPTTRGKRLRSTFVNGLVFGLLFGVGVAFGTSLVNGFLGGVVHGLSQGLVSALGVGLVAGLVFGLADAVVAAFGGTHDLHGTSSPWRLLTTDRAVTVTRALVVGLVYGLVHWLVFGLEGAFMQTFALSSSVLWGRLLYSAWGNWLVFARFWLPLTGRLPWRPKLFLEDAYNRGVLRQAGAVYQFRHARLRDHLTTQYRDKPKTTPPLEDTQGNEAPRPMPEPR